MSAERAAFMPMGDSSDFLPKKAEKGAGAGGSKRKTTRLALDLFEPDENSFPEFNYAKLVQIEKKKQKILSKLPNGNNTAGDKHDDPFANDDHDDIAKITRELEAKYGNGSAYSKSSKTAVVDRGAGYDISDSFIDDTEAYDEMIPDEVETHRGGFYINSGALEFKKLSNFERPGDELIMPKAKKRALSTTSESASESEVDGKPSSSKQKKKSKIAEAKSKPPGAVTTSSSDEQGKAKKAKKDKSKDLSKEDKKKEPEKAIKTTTVKDMLRAKRDNLLKEQGKASGSGTATTTDNDEDDGAESISSAAGSESSRDSHPETTASTSNEVKLPESLSSDVTQLILSLQQQTTTSIKGSMFDAKTLDKLVLIDNESKAISSSVRLQTFLYLEKLLSVSKKTLFEKVKQHRITSSTQRMTGEIDKLRKIIADTLPNQIEKYEKEKASFELKKSNGETVHEPRRRYHWNDASRQALSDIVHKVEDLFKEMKTKKFENCRQFLEFKLKETVLPLWPEGWIKLKDLDNELEKKRKREAKAQTNNQLPKPNTSSTNNTNGKPQTQKTENSKQSEPKQQQQPMSNGKAPTPSPTPSISPPALLPNLPITAAAATTSVIKRSSDHSISSIIASASPSPPMKVMSPIPKPKLIELDKYSNPSDLLKVTTQQKEKLNRSDSTDSDCVEIVESFEHGRMPKSMPNHNNNRVTRSPSPLPPVPQKKFRGESPPEMVEDKSDKAAGFSLILAGLNSLTNSSSKSSSNFNLNKDSVSSNHRKSETSSHVKSDVNGTNDHFLDPPSCQLQKPQNSNVNYSIGELYAMNRGSFNNGNVVQGKIKRLT